MKFFIDIIMKLLLTIMKLFIMTLLTIIWNYLLTLLWKLFFLFAGTFQVDNFSLSYDKSTARGMYIFSVLLFNTSSLFLCLSACYSYNFTLNNHLFSFSSTNFSSTNFSNFSSN
jgi:hypothetical protein